MNNGVKNIIVGAIVASLTIATIMLIQRRDEKILSHFYRWGQLNDTVSIAATEQERKTALQFSDTTLPGLKELGLITGFTRTEIETIVTVSGKTWNERSVFFKEQLLDQIFIYNRVNGFAVNTKVVDDETSRLYAQIVPPDQRMIF